MDSTHSLVRENLVYYCGWTGVEPVEAGVETVLKGTDPSGDVWYVLPMRKESEHTELTMRGLAAVFKALGDGFEQIIAGVIDEDGTVVYYKVRSGIQDVS